MGLSSVVYQFCPVESLTSLPIEWLSTSERELLWKVICDSKTEPMLDIVDPEEMSLVGVHGLYLGGDLVGWYRVLGGESTELSILYICKNRRRWGIGAKALELIRLLHTPPNGELRITVMGENEAMLSLLRKMCMTKVAIDTEGLSVRDYQRRLSE